MRFLLKILIQILRQMLIKIKQLTYLRLNNCPFFKYIHAH